MRKLIITAAFAVLALAAGGTAGATAPTTIQESFPRPIPHYLPCPGFDVRGDFQIDRTTTTFYDNAGTAIRRVQHVHADGILSNPLTGKSVADSGDFKVTVDLLTGERVLEGKVNTATVPGVGVVYHAVGRLAFEADGSVFEAGPHDDADGTFGALCDYLAGA
jgi:hypothetical protein